MWVVVVALVVAPSGALVAPFRGRGRFSHQRGASAGDVEDASWEPREDWALLDGAESFTRRNGDGGAWLFYDELRAADSALAARSPVALRERLAALDAAAPPEPRTLENWARADAGRYSGDMDGDRTTLVASRESVIDVGGGVERRYVETLAGELVRLGAARETAAGVAADAAAPPSAVAGAPTSFGRAVEAVRGAPLASALAGGAVLLNLLWFAFAVQHAGDVKAPAGDSFLIESSTIVTQKKAGEGATVTRTQRQRSVRSTSNPGGRVETQTVVRRTSVDDGGNIVVQTTKDRAVNRETTDPRPVSAAEMARLLRGPAQIPALPPPALPSLAPPSSESPGD